MLASQERVCSVAHCQKKSLLLFGVGTNSIDVLFCGSFAGDPTELLILCFQDQTDILLRC
jgi:hypothetical protein